MWGIRRQVSLLLSEGHPANTYTIGRVWDECQLVVDRINNRMVTEAVLLQSAVASLLTKEGGKQFSKLTKKLSSD